MGDFQAEDRGGGRQDSAACHGATTGPEKSSSQEAQDLPAALHHNYAMKGLISKSATTLCSREDKQSYFTQKC